MEIIEIGLIISGLSFGASLISLGYSRRNSNLNVVDYNSRTSKSTKDLLHIDTDVIDNYHVIKLVLLNPGPVKTILKCLKCYNYAINTNRLSRFLGISGEWRQFKVDWWPMQNLEYEGVKFVKDEHKNLLVGDLMYIHLKIDGFPRSGPYKFELYTTVDMTMLISESINKADRYFNLDFRPKWTRSSIYDRLISRFKLWL